MYNIYWQFGEIFEIDLSGVVISKGLFMKKRIFLVVLTVLLGIMPTLNVWAVTSKEMKEQKKETEKQLSSVQSNIDNIESDKELMENEIQEIDSQLVDLLLTVSILEDDIATKDIMIEKAGIKYEEAKAKEEEQDKAMKMRIKFMYEKGDQSYIELFLQSASISELLNKVEYVEKLYAYDRELLLAYQKTKEEVFELKTTLETEKAELEEVQADYLEQSEQLQNLIDEKLATIDNFEEQLATAKAEASKYQAQLKEQNAAIKQLEAEEAARKAAEEAAKKAAAEAAKKAAEEAKRKAAEEAAASKKAAEEARKSSQENSDDSGDSDGESSSNSESSGESSYDEGGEEEHHEEEHHSSDPGDSSKGQEIANFACQFIGNPYVSGGTSLTEGADCSGFTSAVFREFGINLPRSSSSQAAVGREVSYSEAQPGDILYYGGHVAIYIGNGQIVHASTPATGIKISNALYRSVITVRRVV